MSLKKTAVRRAALFAILCAIVVSAILVLSSCGSSVIRSKEELFEEVNSSAPRSYSNVSSYLKKWGFPDSDSTKLKYIENLFKNYYVGEMPEVGDAARSVALNFLENYYDDIDLSDEDKVTDALINCYIAAVGDKYSHYMNPEEYESYNAEMSGEFCGIGVYISYSALDGTYEILNVFEDSPAETAGILPGDFIVAVDGTDVDILGYEGTLGAVKGEQGSSVSITVLRGTERIEFSMLRTELEDITVTHEILAGNIGYIRITQFIQNTASQFTAAVDSLTDAGVSGIIFDVRSNPGGYLTSIIEVLDYLLPDGGDIVGYKYYDGSTDSTKASDGHQVSLPFAVLCNEYTASAAELFTSALRDYAAEGIIDATIIGQTTYKKGTMQSTFEYKDGSAITISIALYNPPSGVNYEGIGITPDHIIENTGSEDLQLEFAINCLTNIQQNAA